MESIYQLLRPEPNKDHRLVSAEIERLAIVSPSSGTGEVRVARYEPDLRKVIECLVENEGWKSVYKSGTHILGAEKDGCTMSFEPGGQWEVSAPPMPTVVEWRQGQDKLDKEILGLCSAKGLGTLHIGLNPWETPDDIPILPSPRYDLMDAHFKKVGGRGREMMRLTVGLQINLDYNTEKHAMQLLRAGFLLAPPLSALFSNSPFSRGGATGNLSERHFIWNETDPDRSGFIEESVRGTMTLKEYAAFLARAPMMYAFNPAGESIDPEGRTLEQLDPALQERNALPALKQMFTETRLKTGTVELRFFDQVPPPLFSGATAITVGLLYDEENLREILSTQVVSAEPLRRAMDLGAKTGLADEGIYADVRKLFALAEKGLVRRGFGEEKFLAPVERLIRDRKTPAEYWEAPSGRNPLSMRESFA